MDNSGVQHLLAAWGHDHSARKKSSPPILQQFLDWCEQEESIDPQAWSAVGGALQREISGARLALSRLQQAGEDELQVSLREGLVLLDKMYRDCHPLPDHPHFPVQSWRGYLQILLLLEEDWSIWQRESEEEPVLDLAETPQLPPEYAALLADCRQELQGGGTWPAIEARIMRLAPSFAREQRLQSQPLSDALGDIVSAFHFMLQYGPTRSPEFLVDGWQRLALALDRLGQLCN